MKDCQDKSDSAWPQLSLRIGKTVRAYTLNVSSAASSGLGFRTLAQKMFAYRQSDDLDLSLNGYLCPSIPAGVIFVAAGFCCCNLLLLDRAQRPDLLEAGACGCTLLPKCPEARLAGGWGLLMYLVTTLPCPEASHAGGWGLLM